MKLLRSRPNFCAVVAFAALLCAVAPASPVWLDFTVISGILALIALSAGLSFGQAGILSMAQGAFAAIGAYAAAVATARLGWPSWTGLVPALALPAALAWPLARGVSQLPPLATALATLAVASLTEIVARNWDRVTGGYVGIAGIPPLAGFAKPILFNGLVWLCVCLAVLLYENLMHSPFGRALNVIRHDRTRAIADGVAVAPLLSATLALSALLAGLGGWLYAHYITYISPQSLDTTVSISALLMAVVGGARYVLGPILGTLLLNLAAKLLPAEEAQGLFYGGSLIVALLIAPDGVLGRCERLMMKLRRTPLAVSEGSSAPPAAALHPGRAEPQTETAP